MEKKKKVLLLFNSPYSKPRGYDYKEEFADPDNMYTENDVYQALLTNGYDVSILGLYNSVIPLFEELEEDKPDIIFNLVEVYDNKSHLEKNIAALLAMISSGVKSTIS